MKVAEVPIGSIRIAGRFRHELGDIERLAASIREVGLLHPVVVTEDMRLVAGQRRLEALRILGERTAPVRIARDLAGAAPLLAAERDENTCRKDMTASEMYALGKALEELERPNAERRHREGSARGGVGEGGDPPTTTLKTRDVVAPTIGLSGPQWGRLKHIGDRAADGDEPAASVLAAVDRGDETISGGYSKLRATGRIDSPPATRTNGQVHTKTFKGRDATEGARRVINTLVGITSVIGGLDPDELHVTADEAASWERDLARARKSISKLLSLIKESNRG